MPGRARYWCTYEEGCYAVLVIGCLSAPRFHNKGVYVKVGLQKISHTRNLHKDIKLQVDQHEVELPSIEGLIFINIPR